MHEQKMRTVEVGEKPDSEEKNPEQQPQQCQAPPQQSEGQHQFPNPAAMDSLFAQFFAEVDSVSQKNDKPKKIETLPDFLFDDAPNLSGRHNSNSSNSLKRMNQMEMFESVTPPPFSSAEEECIRLTSKTFTNLFEVLRLPPNASDEEIKKAFKKMSLLVHPDKCKHEKAGEAFDVANKAYEELQKPEMKDKYRLVIAEAKKRVLRSIEKENRQRKQRGVPLLPTKTEDIQSAVAEMCDSLLKEVQDNIEYAEKCRKANDEWEKKAEEDMIEEARRQDELKRKWAESREGRVGDWKEFKEEVQAKRMKTGNFVPVTHHREQRTLIAGKAVGHTRKKPLGIDESYKQNWR